MDVDYGLGRDDDFMGMDRDGSADLYPDGSTDLDPDGEIQDSDGEIRDSSPDDEIQGLGGPQPALASRLPAALTGVLDIPNEDVEVCTSTT